MKKPAKRTRTRRSASRLPKVTIREDTGFDVTPVEHRLSPRVVDVGDEKRDKLHAYICEVESDLVLFGARLEGPWKVSTGYVERSINIDGTHTTIEAVENFATAIMMAVEAYRALPKRKIGPERQVG